MTYNRRSILKGLAAATIAGVTGCSTLYNGVRDLGSAVGLPPRESTFDATTGVARVTYKHGRDTVVCEDKAKFLGSLFNGVPDKVTITTKGVERTYTQREDIKAHCNPIFDNVVKDVKSYIKQVQASIKKGNVDLGQTPDGKPIGTEVKSYLGSGVEVTIRKDDGGKTAYFGVTKHGNPLVTIEGVPSWLSSDLEGLASDALRQAERKHIDDIVGTSTSSK